MGGGALPKDPVTINVNINNNQVFNPFANQPKPQNSDGPSDKTLSAFGMKKLSEGKHENN